LIDINRSLPTPRPLLIRGRPTMTQAVTGRQIDLITWQSYNNKQSLSSLLGLLGWLLPEINLHTVESARRQIIYLSHVSKLWRDVVPGISALFTQANWGGWPFWLVDMWRSRAGLHLLNIVAGMLLLGRMSGAPGRPYRELLEWRAVQVGNLDVYCGGVWNPD